MIAAVGAALLFLPMGPAAAAASSGFEIETQEGWGEAMSPYQGVSASYVLDGSNARLDVSSQDAAGETDAGNLSWQDLFHPHFDLIDIQMDARTSLDGIPAKYCLYKIKKSNFKKELEGKADRLYLNYVVISGGLLYSMTFSDDEAAFAGHQQDFMRMVRGMRFARAPQNL